SLSPHEGVFPPTSHKWGLSRDCPRRSHSWNPENVAGKRNDRSSGTRCESSWTWASQTLPDRRRDRRWHFRELVHHYCMRRLLMNHPHPSTSAEAPSLPPLSPCPVCGGLECLCRPRFFAGQLLSEEDLRALDHYIVGKNKLHNRYVHGWGVV